MRPIIERTECQITEYDIDRLKQYDEYVQRMASRGRIAMSWEAWLKRRGYKGE